MCSSDLKKFMGEKKRWAKSLGEIGIRARGLRLQVKTSGGWSASKSGWRVHEDSLLELESTGSA